MRERRAWAVTVVLLLALATPSLAAPIPSKAAAAAPVRSVQADRAAIEAWLARDEVSRALAAHGLRPDEVRSRVAQLSAEDVSTLAGHLDQIQAAGEVPKYIWILLAILIGVTIIVTIF
ncbi:MAG TPA: PA2779 family protein [Vicinamibacteria bacterium]|nr:PA2779 family protein [Vicinamibacteria bacterium]